MKFGCHQVPNLFQVVSVWTPLPSFECHRFITITCQPGKGKGSKAITQSFCAVRVISLCWFTEFSLSKLSEGWNAARYPRSCWTLSWSEMLEAGGTEMTKHTGAQLWQVLHNSGILGKSSRWIKWMWTHQEEAAGAEQWFWTGYKVDRHCGMQRQALQTVATATNQRTVFKWTWCGKNHFYISLILCSPASLFP